MIAFIKEKFQIRQCKNFKYQDRACLNYHIKKCLAPCQDYVSREDYKIYKDFTKKFLQYATKDDYTEVIEKYIL